jgi:NAD(P)-dependent dehydrogenase (short-subunit alcohol dehydrogenase family)
LARRSHSDHVFVRGLDGALSEEFQSQGEPSKGRAEEVVSLMLYLASERAGFITGQCYPVNGGKYFL